MKVFSYILVLLLLSGSSDATEVEEYGCSLMVAGEEERKTIAAPGLRILDYNADNRLFRFLPDGPYEVTAVICERSSVIPAEYDNQVLVAGVPLYIKANDRIVVLEFSSQEYQLRLIDGPSFTAQEQEAIQARLKSFLPEP